MWSVAALNKKFDDELGIYNSLSDPLLAEYFKRPNVRSHLIQNGLMTPDGEIIPEAKSKLSDDRKKQLTKLLNETLENGQSLDRVKSRLDNLYEMKELERMLKARLVHRAKKVYSGPNILKGRTRKEMMISSREEESQVNKWISGQDRVQEQIVSRDHDHDDDEHCNGSKNVGMRGKSCATKPNDDASYGTTKRSKSNKCRSQSITSLDMERVKNVVGREGVRMNVSNNSRPHSSYGLRRDSIPSSSSILAGVEEIEKLDDVISLEGDSWKDSSSELSNNNTLKGNNENGCSKSEYRNGGSINLTFLGSEHENEGIGKEIRRREAFTPTYSFAPSRNSTSIAPFSTTTSLSSLIASKIQRERKSITAQLTLRFDGITSTSTDFRSIKVYQEIDRGCHSFLVFSGTEVNPGQQFSFKVVRKAKKPFSLSVFVDGVRDLRISTCCEYKHVPGVKLGHFTIVNVSGGGMQCEYCTGSISWKEFWRNRKKKKLQEPLASPLKGTPSPVNTIADDGYRRTVPSSPSSSSSSILTEVDYQEELEEYNKEAFEKDEDSEEVGHEGRRNGKCNEEKKNTLRKDGGRKEEGMKKKINEMEKNGKRNHDDSSFPKDGIGGNMDRSEQEEKDFQVVEEEIEGNSPFPSESSKGTEEDIVEDVIVAIVDDENTSGGEEEGTKSSYEGIEVMEEDDLEKEQDKKTAVNREEEEGATSNDTSFTSEVETLEIL